MRGGGERAPRPAGKPAAKAAAAPTNRNDTGDPTQAQWSAFWGKAKGLVVQQHGETLSEAVHRMLEVVSLKDEWLQAYTLDQALLVLTELSTGRPLADVMADFAEELPF